MHAKTYACPTCEAVHADPLLAVVINLQAAVDNRCVEEVKEVTGQAYRLAYQQPPIAGLMEMARMLEKMDDDPELWYAETALNMGREIMARQR